MLLPASSHMGSTAPATISAAQVGDVLNYVKEAKMPVNYIAVANPMDREKRKLSLAAPIYAAAHNGLVLPLKDIPLSKAPPLEAWSPGFHYPL